MVPIPGDAIESYIERQCKMWFSKSGLDPLGVGRELRKHGFLRTILHEPRRQDHRLGDAHDRIARWDTQFEGFCAEDRDRTLQSFLAHGQSCQAASGRPGRAVPVLPGATVDPGDEPAGACGGAEAGILLA